MSPKENERKQNTEQSPFPAVVPAVKPEDAAGSQPAGSEQRTPCHRQLEALSCWALSAQPEVPAQRRAMLPFFCCP